MRDDEPFEAKENASTPTTSFAVRQRALAARVATAADQLQAEGLKPTVARIRAALGGGSPNDLAPALKAWRTAAGAANRDERSPPSPLPPAIGDLARELWQRACAAAVLDRRTGRAALAAAAVSEEREQLRAQVQALRDQLERESALYGELKVQAARHQTVSRHALEQLEAAHARERTRARALGAAQARIAELTAELAAARAKRPAPRPHRPLPKAQISQRRQTRSPPQRRASKTVRQALPRRGRRRR